MAHISENCEVKWRPPKPLQKSKIPIIGLTGKDLPDLLAPWLMDIAERMQVPIEFVAVPAVTAASSLLGRQVGIFPKMQDDWLVIPNLWGVLVAKPGWMKSPAIHEALGPIARISRERLKAYQLRKAGHDEEMTVFQTILEGLKDELRKAAKGNKLEGLDEIKSRITAHYESKPKPLVESRLMTNDATVEKLALLLNDNPNGLLVVRDEISGWLNLMQKHGREGDREFFLEAWNGYGAYTVDRVGRSSVHLPALCLSILGGIQPQKLLDYIDADLGSDGLMQRFQLMVAPELSDRWHNIDRKPDSQRSMAAEQAFRRLADARDHLTITRFRDNIPGLPWDPEAYEIFSVWRKRLEERLRSSSLTNINLESHFSKYRSLVPSLALIFHLLDCNAVSAAVSARSLQKALAWEKVLAAHAEKIYASSAKYEWGRVCFLANKILARVIEDRDTLRSVYRHHWSGLENKESLNGALAVLKKFNWVETQIVSVNKAQSELIRINPNLLAQGFEFTPATCSNRGDYA